MNGQRPDPAILPLDALDEAILRQVQDMTNLVDPPPADLDDRVRFAIRLANPNIEVSRLFEDVMADAGARAVERVRAVTFESDRLTIMATVSDAADDLLRVEGWLAPAARLRVELRVAEPGHDGRSREAESEDSGRFVFEEVAHGLVQFVVHAGAVLVVTPPLLL